MKKIAALLPKYQEALCGLPPQIQGQITDIRLCVGFAPTLFLGTERRALPHASQTTQTELQDLLFALCDFSVYKHTEELRQGFLPLKGGFRAGICGTAVIKEGRLETVKSISAITIRIPRVIYGAAEALRQQVQDFRQGVLIVGEPSSGKTTLLRDLMVVLSQRRLVVLDERWELTGGLQAMNLDVLYGYPKNQGIAQAVRNLGAELILCDELEVGDLPAITTAAASGVGLIATVHGSLGQGLRPFVADLCKTGAFGTVVQLQGRQKPCVVEKMWKAGALLEAFGVNFAHLRGNICRASQNGQHEPTDTQTWGVP